jgi:hypothetical protein
VRRAGPAATGRKPHVVAGQVLGDGVRRHAELPVRVNAGAVQVLPWPDDQPLASRAAAVPALALSSVNDRVVLATYGGLRAFPGSPHMFTFLPRCLLCREFPARPC